MGTIQEVADENGALLYEWLHHKLNRYASDSQLFRYNPPMDGGAPKRLRWLDLIVASWIVVAQLWYYSRFTEQFKVVVAPVLRKLWPQPERLYSQSHASRWAKHKKKQL